MRLLICKYGAEGLDFQVSADVSAHTLVYVVSRPACLVIIVVFISWVRTEHVKIHYEVLRGGNLETTFGERSRKNCR